MSADKRTIATDALATLGTIIDENQKRDAVHIAVVPCQAAHQLSPGEHVARYEQDVFGVPEEDQEPLGIVDPFLEGDVDAGEWFWLLIYPRQITSLRHVWSHPDFPDQFEPEKTYTKEESEAWLRGFIETADCPDYETVISAATGKKIRPIKGYGSPAYDNDGEYLSFAGRDAHGRIPPEFWKHVENVTGVEIPTYKHASYFSCSC